MKTKLNIAVILVGLSLFAAGQDPGKYDINDPRNPDCPCHKYQQLAEKEYKKLQASADKSLFPGGQSSSDRQKKIEGVPEAKEKVKNGGNINERTSLSANDQGLQKTNNSAPDKKRYHSKGQKFGKRRHARKFAKWRQVLNVAGWDVWKELRDATACYSWK